MKNQRVNWINEDVLETMVRAALGQHTKAIAHATGLSPSQVQYRIMECGGKGLRKNYRDGRSEGFTQAYSLTRRKLYRAYEQANKFKKAKNAAKLPRETPADTAKP
jgi:hypothetical protein